MEDDEWHDVEQPQPEQADSETVSDDALTTGSASNAYAQASPQEDDWHDVQSPQQAQTQGQGEDDWHDVPHGDWTPAGSAVAGAVKAAGPSVGGLGVGLATGAALTLATANPVVGLIGGFAAGMGAGIGLDVAQDKLLALTGNDKPFKEAREANPNAFDYAGMLPSLALLRPNIRHLDAANRVIGAGIGAGAEAVMQTVGSEPYDAKKILAAGVLGGSFASTNRLGTKFTDAGEKLVARAKAYRAGNTNPDVKDTAKAAEPAAEANPDDIVPQGQEMEFGDISQNDGRTHLGEYDTETPVQTPVPTPDEMKTANQQPNAVGGVATEQQTAAVIPGTGNPGQAAGAVHEAAGPTRATKDQPQSHPATTESKVLENPPTTPIDTGLIPADIQASTASPPSPVDHQRQGAGPDVRPPLEADNHTPGVAEKTRLPTGLDPVEASQIQRQALSGVKDRMAAQQKGEDYPHPSQVEDLPNPKADRPAAPQMPPATAAAVAAGPRVRGTLTAKPGTKVTAPVTKARPVEQTGLHSLETPTDALPPGAVRLGPAPKAEPSKPYVMPEQTSAQRAKLAGRRGPPREPELKPLTPDELRAHNTDRKFLADAGVDMSVYDGVHPRTAFEPIRKVANETRAEIAAAKAEQATQHRDGRVRTETARAKSETGVTSSSNARAKMIDETNAKYSKLRTDHGPDSESGKAVTEKSTNAEVQAHAKKVWEAAKAAMGGDPFVPHSGIYVPVKRGAGDHLNDAIQWLKAARASANAKSVNNKAHENFRTLQSLKGMGKLDRETGKVDAQLRLQPQVEETGAEAATSKYAETQAAEGGGRSPVGPFVDKKGTESPVYHEEQKSLRDWYNKLDDAEHDLLTSDQPAPELESSFNTTQQPGKLLKALQDDLSEKLLQRRPRGELNIRHERKEKPVSQKEIEDGLLAPGDNGDTERTTVKGKDGKPIEIERAKAADKGQVLDKNSEAFKEAAAKYADMLKPPEKTPNQIKAEDNARLAAEKRGQRGEAPRSPEQIEAAEKAAERARDTEAPLEGTWAHFNEKIEEFAHNESGAGKLMFSWAKRNPRNPVSPDADKAAREVTESLGEDYGKFNKSSQTVRTLGRMIAERMPYSKDKAERTRISREAHRWMEDHTVADDMKITDDKVFQTVHLARKAQAETQRILDEIRFFDPEDVNGKSEFGLPPKSAMTGIEKQFVNRMRKSDPTIDKVEQDPFKTTNRTLSTTRGSLMDRSLFTLTDGKGLRIPVKTTDTGVNLWWHGKASSKAVPPDFQGHVGEKLTLTVNKKPVDFTVDNATVREIQKHIRDEHGKVIEFHESPVVTSINAMIHAQDALDTFKFLRDIKNNNEFLKLTSTKPPHEYDANQPESQFTQTKLKAFQKRGNKDLYMNRRIAEQLDDIHQAGFDEAGLAKARALSQNLIKTLYVMNPLIHGLNVTASWAMQRGLIDLISPRGNYWLAKTGIQAIHSVMTQHVEGGKGQKDYADAMSHGLTLLLPGTRNMRLMQRTAQRAGTLLSENSNPVLDKVFSKHFDVTIREVGQGMMRYANTITWGMTDALALQRYYENIQRHHMWAGDAVKEVHEFQPNYQMKPRFGESILGQAGARVASKIGQERALSLFAPYHAHLWEQTLKPFAKMVKGQSREERIKAASQIMALATGIYLVYPYLLDKGAQQVTDNKHASVGRRGPLALAQSLSDMSGLTSMARSVTNMIAGKAGIEPAKKLVNPPRLSTDVFMPAIPVSMAQQLLRNEDNLGHPIAIKPRVGSVKGYVGAAAHVADWAAQQVFPPYQIANSEFKKQGKGSFAGRMVEEQFGIKNPTPQAVRYSQKQGTEKREEKYRLKHPGILEKPFR